MATQAAKSGGGAENINNGTVVGMQAADAVTGSALSTKGLNEMATGSEYGSKVVAISQTTGNRNISPTNATDSVGIMAATAGVGTSMAFTPNPANRTATDPQFIIRGVSTTISGSGNTFLQVGGSDYAGKPEGVNKTKADRRVGLYSDTSIDVLEPSASGLFPYRTKGSNAGDAQAFVRPSGDGLVSVSDADFDDRGTPGKLNYMSGSPTPTSKNYAAKDSKEV
jgi:hypothetical protein